MSGRPADSPFAPGPARRYRSARRRNAGGRTMLNGLNGMVDVDRGIISREIFVNEEIYRREQEEIFARAWLFIGHESQIPRPGGFLVSSMGEEAVIPGRARTGRIHVVLDSCRHRGT